MFKGLYPLHTLRAFNAKVHTAIKACIPTQLEHVSERSEA